MSNDVSTEKATLASTLPAPVVMVASALIPGLGQILCKKVRRGLLIFASVITILALIAWRIEDLAHREPDAFSMFTKALDRRPFFILGILILIGIFWIGNVLDARVQTRSREKRIPVLFGLAIVIFFILGWQISGIDVYKAVRDLPETIPPLLKVLWPWKAAIEYPTDTISAAVPIEVPCDDDPPSPPERIEGEPYLVSDPTCGVLSQMATDGTVTPGTTLHLEGEGFEPNTETHIWWIDPIGNEFRPRQDNEYVLVTTDENGAFSFDLIMPYRMIAGAEGTQTHHVEARQVFRAGGPRPAKPLLLTISRMVETIMMGMMATLFGIVLAIPVSFLAARNLMGGSILGLTAYYFTRTVMNIVRAIEPLIWALIAVVWVGLGPFAGIIALTIHSVAALTKLYSEAIENIDPGPIEAIQATGATRLQTIMYAVVPQMIPPFVSFSIYRWDINVRMSTVIGLVGGGGIGFILVQYIRLLDYRAAGIAVWFIAITVAILDYVSAEIRAKFV